MESNLSRRIIDALSSISAHDLQVLAENLATIKFPHRFRYRQLVRRGRNNERQTTIGWPDAYVVTDDGSVDAVEATRLKQNWRTHLEDDFQKAISGDEHKLFGYTFIGGYPTNAPTSDELDTWIERFASIGIAPKNLCLLIGKELVLELEEPQYARILTDILKISIAPRQFSLLRPGNNVENISSLYKPSESDFQQELVPEPSIFRPLLHTLETNQIALIRGHGASGKTTLAHLVAHTNSPAPTYYLDLGSGDLPQNYSYVLSDLAEFALSGTFIVDNVHLDESLASKIIDDWNEYSKIHGSHLLLLGRETNRKSGSPINGVTPAILRAGRSEMRGIISRVLSRAGFAVPTFREDDYTNWLAL